MCTACVIYEYGCKYNYRSFADEVVVYCVSINVCCVRYVFVMCVYWICNRCGMCLECVGDVCVMYLQCVYNMYTMTV